MKTHQERPNQTLVYEVMGKLDLFELPQLLLENRTCCITGGHHNSYKPDSKCVDVHIYLSKEPSSMQKAQSPHPSQPLCLLFQNKCSRQCYFSFLFLVHVFTPCPTFQNI